MTSTQWLCVTLGLPVELASVYMPVHDYGCLFEQGPHFPSILFILDALTLGSRFNCMFMGSSEQVWNEVLWGLSLELSRPGSHLSRSFTVTLCCSTVSNAI